VGQFSVKKFRYSKTLKVEGITLFFIGDTTLTYLGKKNFFEHLQGGLINRCILIYDDYLPSYDDYPQNYNVNADTKEFYNDIAMNIIQFAKDNAHFKGIDYNYTKSKILKAYEKNIVLQKNELLSSNNIFGNLYNRTIQNFRALIILFHYIKCFNNQRMENTILDETIQEVVNFCQKYFNYDDLINRLNGINDEEMQDIQLQKIMNKIEKVGIPCSFRDIYKPLKINKDNLIKAIAGKYKIDTVKSIILEQLITK
jgi:hypothetical protein